MRAVALFPALLPIALAQRSFSELPKSKPPARAEIVEVNRISGPAPHSAFTDLIRHRERFYCVYREAQSHVSDDGVIRVLSSTDGNRWTSFAKLDYPVADLRDPKITVDPRGDLLLTAAARMRPPSDYKFKSMMWRSHDGRDWTSAEEFGDHDFWLWRVQFHRGRGYSMGYAINEPRSLRSYLSMDGYRFDVLGNNVFDKSYPNETSLIFNQDESALCLLRRDGDPKTALLGRSRPPYRGWEWKDLGIRIGGPHMIKLPDNRIVAAVRLYEGKTRTSLCWLEPSIPALTEFLVLPSGGDTSYAGLVWHDGLLHVSYYSSHEEKTAVYLAKIKLPPAY